MQKNGYYNVGVHSGGAKVFYTVYARSDFDAAMKVRRITGLMARSDKDVNRLTEKCGVLLYEAAHGHGTDSVPSAHA